LPSGKSSEAERERMEPQERNERVCGGCPDDMLILMEYGPGYIIFVTRGSHEKRGMGNCLGFRAYLYSGYELLFEIHS